MGQIHHRVYVYQTNQYIQYDREGTVGPEIMLPSCPVSLVYDSKQLGQFVHIKLVK